MRLSPRSVPFVLLLALSCGGDEDPTQPEPDGSITVADLVGSWNATSVTHTNNADATQTFEVIDAGGEVRITILANGSARTWVEFDGMPVDEWDALITVSGDIISSDPVEEGRPTVAWTFTLVADVLTLTRADSEFDFTLSGADPVSTTEVLVLARN